MIVVTVVPSSLNQIEFHMVQNQDVSCHHVHIPFNFKGNGNIFFRVKGRVRYWVTIGREERGLNIGFGEHGGGEGD